MLEGQGEASPPFLLSQESIGGKRRTQAPVNGGRNYEIDRCSYVNKSGYMLEHPVHLTVLTGRSKQ